MGAKDIDTSIWITQQALADQLGIRVQNVHNWVRRRKIQTKQLPGSRIRLVNKYTITVDSERNKNR